MWASFLTLLKEIDLAWYQLFRVPGRFSNFLSEEHLPRCMCSPLALKLCFQDLSSVEWSQRRLLQWAMPIQWGPGEGVKTTSRQWKFLTYYGWIKDVWMIMRPALLVEEDLRSTCWEKKQGNGANEWSARKKGKEADERQDLIDKLQILISLRIPNQL